MVEKANQKGVVIYLSKTYWMKQSMTASGHTVRQKQQRITMHGEGGRTSALPLMLLTVGVFWLASLIFSAKGLPDYESYEQIYEIGGLNFALSSTELLFVVIIQASKILGLDYEQFRSAILLISAGLLSISLFRVDRWLKSSNFNGNIAKLKMHPLIIIITSAALLVFLLEFFQVRIRGGLALSLVSFAFSLYLTAKRPNGLKNIIAVPAFLLFAYGIHAFTAIVLGYFLFAPFLYGILFSKLRPSFFAPVLRIIAFSLLMATSFYFVFMVSILSEARGEHLASPLNVFRLFCISIVPLLLMVLDFLLVPRSAKIIGTHKNSNASMGSDRRITAVLRRRLSWITFSTICYLALAFALLVLDSTGFISTSGEAIVRIFTLSSVPAIFVILLGSSKYLRIWLFLLVINSLFFVNTLATPMRAG